jgi:hypothetical protein
MSVMAPLHHGKQNGRRAAVVRNFRATWSASSFTRLPLCTKLFFQKWSSALNAAVPLGVALSMRQYTQW